MCIIPAIITGFVSEAACISKQGDSPRCLQIDLITCEAGALTWGGIPEEGTAPLGGRFLLVTEAQEKACRKCNKPLLLVLASHSQTVRENVTHEHTPSTPKDNIRIKKNRSTWSSQQRWLMFDSFSCPDILKEYSKDPVPCLKGAYSPSNPQITILKELTLMGKQTLTMFYQSSQATADLTCPMERLEVGHGTACCLLQLFTPDCPDSSSQQRRAATSPPWLRLTCLLITRFAKQLECQIPNSSWGNSGSALLNYG